MRRATSLIAHFAGIIAHVPIAHIGYHQQTCPISNVWSANLQIAAGQVMAMEWPSNTKRRVAFSDNTHDLSIRVFSDDIVKQKRHNSWQFWNRHIGFFSEQKVISYICGLLLLYCLSLLYICYTPLTLSSAFEVAEPAGFLAKQV